MLRQDPNRARQGRTSLKCIPINIGNTIPRSLFLKCGRNDEVFVFLTCITDFCEIFIRHGKLCRYNHIRVVGITASGTGMLGITVLSCSGSYKSRAVSVFMRCRLLFSNCLVQKSITGCHRKHQRADKQGQAEKECNLYCFFHVLSLSRFSPSAYMGILYHFFCFLSTQIAYVYKKWQRQMSLTLP